MCKVIMTANKTTKGTVQFKEIVESGQKPVIGTLYVPKETLKNMGWASGKNISIDVKVPRETKKAEVAEAAPAPAPAPKKRGRKPGSKKVA